MSQSALFISDSDDLGHQKSKVSQFVEEFIADPYLLKKLINYSQLNEAATLRIK